MALQVNEFADKIRAKKPEYSHLDNTDLMQMVAQKKPDLLRHVDRMDLAKTMKDSRAKKISQDRQKEFGALSGYSRFMAGTGEGMLEVYNGVKQLLGGDVEKFKEEKKVYMEASEGDKLAATGEIFGGLAATAPVPIFTGAKLIAAAVKPVVKTAIKYGTAAAVGAGMGATELVDEGETRAKNAAFGALFGAGGAAAGALLKKTGAKAFNALKKRYKNADIQELMDLSKKYDIPLSKADIIGEGKATEQALESIPGVGMAGFRKKGAEKVQTAIKKEAGKIGADWDEGIQESLSRKAKEGKKKARVNYNEVEKLSGTAAIKPENALAKTIEHEEDIAGSILGSETNPFTKIKENLSKKDRSFTDLRKDRTDLGKAAQKAADSGDRNLARQLKDIKKGVESDIDDLISKKIDGTSKKAELKEAYKKARTQYKEEVIPYTDKKILNALKSDTPDEIFEAFIKPKKGDRARNFYNLLDDKGKKSLRDGFLDNAITGATVDKVTSPAKLAGYLERMSKPVSSVFKGQDLKEIQGFAKIMRHAEKYGQFNQAPSNGMALIPYLKGSALIAAGAGGVTSPGLTAAGVLATGALAKLASFMKTKGKGFGLASAEIGSEAFEKQLTKFMNQLPKASAVTASKIEDN